MRLYLALTVFLAFQDSACAGTADRWKRDADVVSGLASSLGGFISGFIKGSSVSDDNQDKQGAVDPNGKLAYCSNNKKDCEYVLCLAENFQKSEQLNTLKQGAQVLFNRDMRQALEKDPMISKIACEKVGLNEMGCQGFRSFLGLIDLIDPDKGDPMRPTKEPPPDSGLGSLLGGGGLPFVGSFIGGKGTETPVEATVAPAQQPVIVPDPSPPLRFTGPAPPAGVPAPAPAPSAASLPAPPASQPAPSHARFAPAPQAAPVPAPASPSVSSQLIGTVGNGPRPRFLRDAPPSKRPTSGSASGSGKKPHASTDYTDFYETGGGGSGSGGGAAETTGYKQRNCHAEYLGVGG